jgi:hypothetical protein
MYKQNNIYVCLYVSPSEGSLVSYFQKIDESADKNCEAE